MSCVIVGGEVTDDTPTPPPESSGPSVPDGVASYHGLPIVSYDGLWVGVVPPRLGGLGWTEVNGRVGPTSRRVGIAETPPAPHATFRRPSRGRA